MPEHGREQNIQGCSLKALCAWSQHHGLPLLEANLVPRPLTSTEPSLDTAYCKDNHLLGESWPRGTSSALGEAELDLDRRRSMFWMLVCLSWHGGPQSLKWSRCSGPPSHRVRPRNPLHRKEGVSVGAAKLPPKLVTYCATCGQPAHREHGWGSQVGGDILRG